MSPAHDAQKSLACSRQTFPGVKCRQRAGDEEAKAELIPLVYGELRRIARAHLRGERPDHTLQATALVHEAFLRLTGQSEVPGLDSNHFLALASNTMRRVLVDYARAAGSAKRGGGLERVPLADIDSPSVQQPQLLLEVDQLLERLAAIDPTKATVVEMRFFGGLTEAETAAVMGCSSRTVARHWKMAKAWLLKALNEPAAAGA